VTSVGYVEPFQPKALSAQTLKITTRKTFFSVMNKQQQNIGPV